jgi:hypothetical protein
MKYTEIQMECLTVKLVEIADSLDVMTVVMYLDKKMEQRGQMAICTALIAG